MNIGIVKVDYFNKAQASDLAYLLNEYAKDPMGGGEPSRVGKFFLPTRIPTN